jgi:hypothetical protein
VGKTSHSSDSVEQGSTWFDLMTGYLKWKVIGPDINNPFKPPIPLANLSRMLNQREYLCQHVTIRCMCDGYEVMMIVNPNLPRVVSNHPCISTIPIAHIIDYLQRYHLDDFIEAELEKLEAEIREQVEHRKKNMELERQAESATSKSIFGDKKGDREKEKEKQKESSNKAGSRNYRILKR